MILLLSLAFTALAYYGAWTHNVLFLVCGLLVCICLAGVAKK